MAMNVRSLALAILLFIGAVSMTMPARAVPSYSRQTGEPCTSCHVGAYGPMLTPHGRAFKLSGYSDGKAIIPLSLTASASFTHTAKDQAEPASEHDGRNDNIALNEIVGWVAGRIVPHLGSFIAIAWSEPERHAELDHFNVTYAQPLKLGGKDALLGVNLNNAPGSTDPFESFSEFAFPHDAPELVPERIGVPLLVEGLGGQVAGLNTYLWLNESIYAEIGGYRSLSPGLLDTIGVEDEAGKISGVAPYGRLAYQKDFGKQVASVGLVAMHTAIHPEREPGPTNKFTDWGIDATYQYLGNRKNIVAADLAYVHENSKNDFDVEEGATTKRNHSLNSVKASVSYYRNNTYGLTGALFSSWGTRDADLFAPEEDGGSRTGRPNTSGFILQADWTPWGKEDSPLSPWLNLRVGLQYTGYFKFNGASSNYDGFGRDASDNNTVYVFVNVGI
jgi:hypothetical protein